MCMVYLHGKQKYNRMTETMYFEIDISLQRDNLEDYVGNYNTYL